MGGELSHPFPDTELCFAVVSLRVSVLRAGDRGLRAGDRGIRAGDRGLRSGDRGLRAGERELRTGDTIFRLGDSVFRTGDLGFRVCESLLRVENSVFRTGDCVFGDLIEILFNGESCFPICTFRIGDSVFRAEDTRFLVGESILETSSSDFRFWESACRLEDSVFCA